MRTTLLFIAAIIFSVSTVFAEEKTVEETYTIPGVIQAENYSDMSGVEVKDGHIGNIEGGDWVEYDVNIESAGRYLLVSTVSTNNGNAKCEILIDDEEIGDFTCPITGWTAYTTDTLDVILPQGEHTLHIDYTTFGFNTDSLEFIYVGPVAYSSVTFNVSDETAAISAATVSFNSIDYAVDADGSVIISDVEDGTYSYVVSAEGYNDASGSITADGSDIEENVVMQKTVGITSNNLEKITIHPNPASNYITVDQEFDQVTIYTLNGALVKTINNDNPEMDIRDLKDGVYLVNILKSSKVSAAKLIIRK